MTEQNTAEETKRRIIDEYERAKREEGTRAKEEERRIREKIVREKREAREEKDRQWDEKVKTFFANSTASLFLTLPLLVKCPALLLKVYLVSIH